MNVLVVANASQKVIFQYCEEGETLLQQKLYDIVIGGKYKEGVVPSLGFVTAKVRGDKTYYLSYPDVGNRKQANYRAKIFVSAIEDVQSYRNAENDIYDKIVDFAFHNSKNIHHALLGNLQKFVKWEQFIHCEDKIAHIGHILSSDRYASAREILNALKSLEQVDFEYDIIDFLKPGIRFAEADFTEIQLHTLLMLAYYVFERELSEKFVRVKIEPCAHKIRGNFFTLRSAFMLLFENCVKYCQRNSEILLDFNDLPGVLKVDMVMMSVLNDENDLQQAFSPYHRGKNAIKLTPKGEGLGLYIASRLFELNSLKIDLRRLDAKSVQQEGIEYCRNVFIIDIPRKQVIK